MENALVERLHNKPGKSYLVLDGGMGTSLGLMGLNEFDAWSAPRRLDEPNIRSKVKKVHMDFLESGVDIITTNTYDSQFEAIAGEQTFKKSQWVFDNIDLANEAIDAYLSKLPSNCKSIRPLLAMSVGSFATVITGRAETANREQNSDTDCRRREGYGFDASEIRSYFAARLSNDILRYAGNSNVSVLAIETVGDLLEVQVICGVLQSKAELLNKARLSTWVTLTCPTEKYVDTGASISSCIEELAKCSQVTALGINCTEPHLITPIILSIKEVLKLCCAEDKLIVVYPNSGEIYLSRALKEGETDHWKMQSMYKDWNFLDASKEWIDNGANIIGGCCRITADNIAELARFSKQIKNT